MSTLAPVYALVRSGCACLLFMLPALPALTLAAEGIDANPTQQINHDTDFYVAANQGNLLVVETSELALKRGVSGAVKEYAKQMVVAYTQADAELATLAKENGVTISGIQNRAPQARYDALAQRADAELAGAYLQTQIDAHRRAIARYTDTASRSRDPKLQALVKAGLPQLQAHLEQAERLAAEH